MRIASALTLVLLLSPPAVAERAGTPSRTTASPEPVTQGMRRGAPLADAIPVHFEPNRGQAADGVTCLSHPRFGLFTLSGTGASFTTATDVDEVLRMGVRGAAPVTPAFEGIVPAVSHYIGGSDSSLWRTRVPRFSRVVLPRVLPGIDLAWLSSGDRLGYEFRLDAGADPDSIEIDFSGHGGLSIAGDGSLLVRTEGGILRQSRPVAFQRVDGRRREVGAAFEIRGVGRVGFRIGARDRALPLVIDPWIDYSTYLGSPLDSEDQLAMAVDGDGAVFVAGRAVSGNSVSPGSPARTFEGGGSDVFLVRLEADGSGIDFATYFGGSGADQCASLALDGSGRPVIAGMTTSSNLPLQSPFQSTLIGGVDAFFAKFTLDGGGLVFSTYLGASAETWILGLELDSSDDIYALAAEAPSSFPLKNALFPTRGTTAAGLLKMEGDGSALVYSTYIGGTTGVQSGVDLAVDDEGAAYVLGAFQSGALPTRNAYLSSPPGGGDHFLLKVNPAGDDYEFCTYFGGSGLDQSGAILVDDSRRPWIGGYTLSSNLPTTAGCYDGTLGGGSDGFLARFSSDGDTLEYSTFLGSTANEGIDDIALAPDGSLYATGIATGAGLATVDAHQSTYGGGAFDAILVRLSPDGSSLLYSSFIGGSDDEYPTYLALQGTTATVVGTTESSNLPLVDPLVGTCTAGVPSPFVRRVAFVPEGPTGLEAALQDLTVADIAWEDNTSEETSYELERSTDGGGFALLAALPSDAVAHEDSTLARGHAYSYRVRAVNADGGSAYSNTDVVESPPIPVLPPAAPTGLSGSLESPSSVLLSWTDASGNEEQFQVNRSVSGGAFSVRASVIAGTTSYLDTGLLPDRTYAYSVRAVNSIGVSAVSGTVSVTTPDSLSMVPLKGLIKDSPKFGKDKVALTATFTPGEAAREESFDPALHGFTLRLGGEEAPSQLAIPAGDAGWVLKKGKYSWKSPRDSLTKVKVVFDTVKGTFKLTASRLTLASAPANPILLWFASGDDAGHYVAEWTNRKAGTFTYAAPR